MDGQKAIELLLNGKDYSEENTYTLHDVVLAAPLNVLKELNYEIHSNWGSCSLIEAIFCWGIVKRTKRLSVIKHLVENGMDVNSRDHIEGNTLLCQAACYADRECIEYLLAKGANINSANDIGQTPLAVFVETCELDSSYSESPPTNLSPLRMEIFSRLLDGRAKLGGTIYDLSNWPDQESVSWFPNVYSTPRTPPKWFTALLEHRRNLAQTITGFLCASRHLKNGNGKDVYRVIAKMIWEKRLAMAPEKENFGEI